MEILIEKLSSLIPTTKYNEAWNIVKKYPYKSGYYISWRQIRLCLNFIDYLKYKNLEFDNEKIIAALAIISMHKNDIENNFDRLTIFEKNYKDVFTNSIVCRFTNSDLEHVNSLTEKVYLLYLNFIKEFNGYLSTKINSFIGDTLFGAELPEGEYKRILSINDYMIKVYPNEVYACKLDFLLKKLTEAHTKGTMVKLFISHKIIVEVENENDKNLKEILKED